MTRECVQLLVEGGQHVRQIALCLDGVRDRFAGGTLGIQGAVRPEGRGKLPAGEAVERRHRLFCRVRRLGKELERVFGESSVVHEFLHERLHRLAIQAYGRGLGRLDEQHVELRDEVARAGGLPDRGLVLLLLGGRSGLPVLRSLHFAHAILEVTEGNRVDAVGAGHDFFLCS